MVNCSVMSIAMTPLLVNLGGGGGSESYAAKAAGFLGPSSSTRLATPVKIFEHAGKRWAKGKRALRYGAQSFAIHSEVAVASFLFQTLIPEVLFCGERC